MKLSEACVLMGEGIRVVKDGDFDDLELLATSNGRRILSFIERTKYKGELERNQSIACILTTEEVLRELDMDRYSGIAVADRPRLQFFILHHALMDKTEFYGSPFSSRIHPGAVVHPTAYVDPVNVIIGPGTRVGPKAVVLSNVELGERCVIGPGTVLGGDGFEAFRYDEVAMSVRHAGWVRIGNDVEIQANCCVDRGLFGEATKLGDYTKLDNMVHIAHNVVIGRRVFIAAAAMLAGRITIGDDAWIGPGASLTNGMSVGAGASVTIGAVATRNVEAGKTVSGNFAVDHEKFIAFIRTIR